MKLFTLNILNWIVQYSILKWIKEFVGENEELSEFNSTDATTAHFAVLNYLCYVICYWQRRHKSAMSCGNNCLLLRKYVHNNEVKDFTSNTRKYLHKRSNRFYAHIRLPILKKVNEDMKWEIGSMFFINLFLYNSSVPLYKSRMPHSPIPIDLYCTHTKKCIYLKE